LDGIFMNDAGTDLIVPAIYVVYGSGSVDITLRLAAPRLEQATASSGQQYVVIPKVGFIPAAGTPTTFVY
jgi:hypothetical protein